MRKTTMTLTPLALAAALLTGAAHAGETIELGDGLKFDWRLNLTYSLATRLGDPDDKLKAVGSGNKNFSKGDLTANRLSGLLETKLHKDRTGLVVTASTFYDDVYRDSKFNSETRKYHGHFTRLLDTYAYTTVPVGEGRATFRAGRHVVNWGETTFFGNLASAQGPADATKAAVPGSEVKEMVLPEDQISVSWEVTPRWSLLGQWQFGFTETLIYGVGSYLSTADVVGPGAVQCLGGNLPGVGCVMPKLRADRPSKTSQWGIGTRYRVTDETEVGLYFLNYNNRSPSIYITYPPGGPTGMGSYQTRYFDDIQMLAGTATTTFGKLQGNTELSYRKGHPVGTNRAEILQWNVGGMYNIGRTDIADDMIMLAEVAYARVMDVENNGMDALKATNGHGRNSLAFSTTLSLSYPGITEGWDMTIPISYSRQFLGGSAGGVGTTMGGKGDHRISLGATFVRQNNLSIGVSYINYMGSAEAQDNKRLRNMVDRDQLSLTAKYSF